MRVPGLKRLHWGAPRSAESPKTVISKHLESENSGIILSDSKYRCMQYLNQGANGFVVLAVDTEKEMRHALKFIDLAQVSKSEYAEREIMNHFKLKHPHIIKLEEIFVTDTHLVLVLEYADQGDLFSHVKSKGGLDENSARWFFQQLMVSVDFCHRMGVVNRDIKLENILLSSTKDGKKILKLSDFGFSKDTTCQSPPNTRLGTMMYIAPEVFQNVSEDAYDARQSDVWACGVVLYVMLTCRYPFLPAGDSENEGQPKSLDGRQTHILIERTMSNDFDPVEGVSDECNNLLCRILEPNPAKRATVSDIMASTWFRTNLAKGSDTFNDLLMKQLEDHPRLTDELVKEVENILHEACRNKPTSA
jgi:serine/threonine-protein kinase SRK2